MNADAASMTPVVVPYGDGCMLWRSEWAVGAIKRTMPDIENGYATVVILYGEETNKPLTGG